MLSRLPFASVIILFAIALMVSLPHKAEAQQQDYDFREWYLQSLWQLHDRNPAAPTLNAIFGLTDTYITTFIVPNTGETISATKSRLGTHFGGNPTAAQLFTLAVLESYNAGDCSNYTSSQCYMLEITHWAITVQVLGPLLGSTVTFESVKADDYTADWLTWSIPTPPATPSAQPSLPLKYDPTGPDRSCTDFATWAEAQAFFWATQNDAHDLDTDGDGIACEMLPGAPSDAPATQPTPTELTTVQLVQQVQDGVVKIQTPDGSGSGFIVESNGLVITNEHVVRGHTNVTVRLASGTSYAGTVLGYDQVADLASVKIAGGVFHALTLGDSDAVQVGQDVVALGYPLGSQSPVVTDGIVSVKVPINGVQNLQTTAAINPGNSGGPLFNRKGEVVGVNWAAHRDAENVGFAVASNEVKSRLAVLMSGENVSEPTRTTRYTHPDDYYYIDVAPGWALESHADDYAKFTPGNNYAAVTVYTYDLGHSMTLEDFRDWIVSKLRTDTSDWKHFELVSVKGFGGEPGAREGYIVGWVGQYTSNHCVEGHIDGLAMSHFDPATPNVGYLISTTVCEHSWDVYNQDRIDMLDSFSWRP